MPTGKVYLVGAGPGDPGLITLKGLEAIAGADVIIYDFLLNDQLLETASPEAERIYAGKSASVHAKEQDEINNLLVEKAREGKVVVRLKGGDPFVLGRGGEEADYLRKNLIPFEIIPGITSAIAAPAYAGIPVTYRGLASSFAVITGHEDPHKEKSSINWGKLAAGVDTLVFLMGMQNLPAIISRLQEAGKPPDTPIAVIEEGTQPEQKVATGTFKNIVEKAREQNLKAPAVIVIGGVVRCREFLRWFDNRPLFGKRVLVTRARSQAGTLSRLLAERGARPIELPVIDMRKLTDNPALEAAISDISRYQWLIFTSTNGVEAFFISLKNKGLDARVLHGIKIGAIGPATSEAMEKQGIKPDYRPAIFTTEGVLDGLKGTGLTGQRFLLPRANIADNNLTTGLKQMGAIVDEVTTYITSPVTGSEERIKDTLRSENIDVITFTSSSTVTNLMAPIGEEKLLLDGIRIACIGPKTADTARKAGLKVDIIAGQSTIPSLVEAIEQYFQKEEA